MVDNCEAASTMKTRTITFDLANDKIVIVGVESFSVSIVSPTVRLSDLYNAVFKDLARGERLETTCTDKLKNSSQFFSIYESIKRIIDGAMTELAEASSVEAE